MGERTGVTAHEASYSCAYRLLDLYSIFVGSAIHYIHPEIYATYVAYLSKIIHLTATKLRKPGRRKESLHGFWNPCFSSIPQRAPLNRYDNYTRSSSVQGQS